MSALVGARLMWKPGFAIQEQPNSRTEWDPTAKFREFAPVTLIPSIESDEALKTILFDMLRLG